MVLGFNGMGLDHVAAPTCWALATGQRVSGGLLHGLVTVVSHAAWRAGVVMMISYSTGVNRPRAAWRRRRW